MSAIATPATPRPFSPKVLLLFVAGIAAGGAVGYAIGYLLKHLLHVSPLPLRSLTWFDAIAAWLGLVFLLVGIISFFVSTNRKRLARSLEGEHAELPATNAEVHTLRAQGVTLCLAGIMILLPILSVAPLAAHPGSHLAAAIYLAILCLFSAQVFTNVHLWRTSDEFVRGNMLKVGAMTFAIAQGLLFLYAAAERLHLLRAISSWDIIVLILTLYLLIGTVVSVRQTYF